MINDIPQWYRPQGPKTPSEIAAEVSAFLLAALDPALQLR